MVNSFGQFTGDVRVSGHISQAGEEVSVCWPSGLGGCGCVFFFVGWLHVMMLFGCRAVSLRPGSPTSFHSSPLCRLSGQNKWSLDMEMTKRCTECTEWEGRGIALQMRWGNVAVVRWAAEWVPRCFAIPRAQSGPVAPLHFLRVKWLFLYMWPRSIIKCPKRADL